jgi:glycine oxidase
MLAPGAEVTDSSPWAQLALEGWRAYPEFVRDLGCDSIEYRCSGAVELAYTRESWDALQDRRLRQRDLGIDSSELSWREARQMIPALGPAPRGIVYYPRDAVVDPRQIVCRLHELVPVEKRSVSRIRAGTDGIWVDSQQETVSAAAAVLAAGAWTSEITVEVCGAPAKLAQSVPVRGHLVAYKLDPGRVGPIVRADGTYVLQRRSGWLIAGTSEERVGFDPNLNGLTIAAIRQRAERLLPELLRGREPEAWIGFRPGLDIPGPIVRRYEESRLWLAYGHYRNGILMAPSTAQRIARDISSSLGKD